MSDLRKLVGLRIKELRKNKNLKQSQLAELVGVETTSICKIENGEHFPKEENLEKIAIGLNAEVKDLFCFSHIKDRAAMIKEIDSLIKSFDDTELQLVYKFIKNVVF